MDLANLQIEGIFRSKYNLKNYEFSSRNILGNRRLIHVSIPDENSEDRKYFTYDMKTINKTTVNLRCHQRGKNGNKCPAILSCTVAFDIVEKILDAETKSRTKRWTSVQTYMYWNHDLIETYFDYLESHIEQFGEKMEKFCKYLKDTFFKYRLKKGGYDPYSYKFWSWAQDIETDDIRDTTSNAAETCNARLNRNVVTTYQKFSKSAQNLWEAHGEVLDEYARVFNKNQTPSKKRKMNITHRWEYLTMACEDFHNLYPDSQVESLLDFLFSCSSKIPEPSERLEKDPEDQDPE